MHEVPNDFEGRDLRVELLGVVTAGDEALANVLTMAALTVAKNRWLAAPATVFPDVLRTYFAETTTPHLMWTEPFRWPELSTVEVPGAGPAHWLMGLSSSDPEVGLVEDSRRDAPEDFLAAADVAYHDLTRRSTV